MASIHGSAKSDSRLNSEIIFFLKQQVRLFNTLQPHLLFQKMISEFNLESDLALWVLDFLVGRHQQVRVNNTMSSVKVVSTGSP